MGKRIVYLSHQLKSNHKEFSKKVSTSSQCSNKTEMGLNNVCKNINLMDGTLYHTLQEKQNNNRVVTTSSLHGLGSLEETVRAQE